MLVELVDVLQQPGRAGQQQPVTIELEKLPTVQETVTVSATRTDRGLEDQPMRVEVLDAEEIDEKLMMTPGDVVMMLNEMGGMRVQATSPSLGAASVRIQGMRGRYTRFLSDGLPLFGEQVSLGLMQIPPLDLGRAEVIKGVASSLYGAGAMSAPSPKMGAGRWCASSKQMSLKVFPCSAIRSPREWYVVTVRGRTSFSAP